MKVTAFVCLILCALVVPTQVVAQSPPKPNQLTIGIFVRPPFVIKKPNGEYSGFAIELWEKISVDKQLPFIYREFQGVDPLIAATVSGEIDLAITDMTVTATRFESVDFCTPFFHAGLRVMINADRRHSIVRLLHGLRDDGHLPLIGLLAGAVVVLTIVATIVLRKTDETFPTQWHHGFSHSFYHVVSVVMTGKSNYKGGQGPIGRILAAFWIISGVALVAYITSSVTSVMTAQRLQNEISGPNDLGGKFVGVITDTPSADYAAQRGWDISRFDDLPSAATALVAHDIQAIVFDAPALQYFDNAHPELPLTEVGPIFDPHKYAFAVPKGSPNRMPLNHALLKLEEAGFVTALNVRYFGTD
ncbi:hypothetical protein LBMAG51_11120 [Phycisphaerae bacterium]|nr:hypothetical protein LBMAG51_11120 [Phycisphaerae bacterium]